MNSYTALNLESILAWLRESAQALSSKPLLYFLEPNYRVYWVYLLITGLTALFLLRHKAKPLELIKNLFSKKLWLNPSVLLDFKLILFNHIFGIFLLTPLLISQVGLAMAVQSYLDLSFNFADSLGASTLTLSVLFAVCLFTLDDFSRFLVHKLYHEIPLLWKFHAVHHSSTLLTPFTLYRIHPVEMIINAFRSILVFGLVAGCFLYLVDGRIRPYQVAGLSIFSIAFNIFGANLRHSHVWWGWGSVEKLFLSPAQHQIHHSNKAEHFDKNYGVMLACWDRMFGSWVGSSGETVESVGIDKPVKQTLLSHLKGL